MISTGPSAHLYSTDVVVYAVQHIHSTQYNVHLYAVVLYTVIYIYMKAKQYTVVNAKYLVVVGVLKSQSLFLVDVPVSTLFPDGLGDTAGQVVVTRIWPNRACG